VTETREPPSGERLQKVLARAGLGSRRTCEELIADGRVTVDGEVAVLGRRVDPERDRIELDGVAVVVDDDLVYYLLNKPSGYVSTASDPQGRRTVVELVPTTPRVFPVGRLDTDTEGLLLLTNDGELTQLLTHPSFGVVKTYLAEVDGDPAPGVLRQLREGVELDDGVTAPARAKVVQRRGETAAIEIGIHEGRNRQVRRMCAAVGHPVRRLVRTRIGPLHDRQLEPGAWRALSRNEVRRLYEAATPDPGSIEENTPGAENAPG
jgi:23S rRNA pseudouridine2605 synthase